ncbi:MAG: 16S rRNA (guanine(527)-N(7))-methyltransferase RsmG [Pseudomonadota bacterium]
MSRARFAEATGVSRETLERLDALAALLTRWNRKINLVAPGTLPDLWTRHFLDSAQLLPLAPGTRHWADLGSGAGFPGLVIAAMAPETRVTLIESDTRKAAFLTTASAELDLATTVVPRRIEAADPAGADTVTARALAPLDRLLPLALRHAAPGATLLFPKGRSVGEELTAAEAAWHIEVTRHPSVTDDAGCILAITGARHRA